MTDTKRKYWAVEVADDEQLLAIKPLGAGLESRCVMMLEERVLIDQYRRRNDDLELELTNVRGQLRALQELGRQVAEVAGVMARAAKNGVFEK